MSTIVQRSYAPQMRPALVGMIADQVEYSIVTKLCDVTTGIGFGLGVVQSPTLDKGVRFGAANFIGISVRDITLSLSPLDPMAPDGFVNPLDSFGYRVNMGVLSRGHIWVMAGADVVAGDPLFFGANGSFANSAAGNAATGWVTLARNPSDGDTLVINGATLTFKAGGAVGDQANIGATLGDTIQNAVNVLNGTATAGFQALGYRASPPSPMGLPQGSGADTILIAADAPGVAGNALAITSGPAGTDQERRHAFGWHRCGGRGPKWPLAGLPTRRSAGARRTRDPGVTQPRCDLRQGRRSRRHHRANRRNPCSFAICRTSRQPCRSWSHRSLTSNQPSTA